MKTAATFHHWALCCLSEATWPMGSLEQISTLGIWRLRRIYYPKTPGGANSWQTLLSVGITM